jgi:hypothetical protein
MAQTLSLAHQQKKEYAVTRELLTKSTDEVEGGRLGMNRNRCGRSTLNTFCLFKASIQRPIYMG